MNGAKAEAELAYSLQAAKVEDLPPHSPSNNPRSRIFVLHLLLLLLVQFSTALYHLNPPNISTTHLQVQAKIKEEEMQVNHHFKLKYKLKCTLI